MFAALLLAVLAVSTPSDAACPPTATRLVDSTDLTSPEGSAPTHGRVRFLLDIGSDGRVRKAQLVESSGDAAVDAAARDASMQNRYAPRTAGCVAWSSTYEAYWNLEVQAAASPGPSPSPAAVTDACSTMAQPYRVFAPAANRHVHAGTVAVDVDLSSLAAVRSVKLAKGSGFTDTDYEALRLAHSAEYIFIHRPGCPSTALTYRAELTFP